MMLCNQVEKNIDDYLDGYIGNDVAAQIALHVQNCSMCLRELEATQAIRSSLAELPVVAPAEEFFEHAVAHAARMGDTATTRQRVRFGGAIAAAFALILVASVMFEQPDQGSPAEFAELPEVVLERDTVTPIKLVFSSPIALTDARLSLQLPVGVELAGYNGRSDLSWSTNLEPGKNILRLPLVGHMPVSAQLVAKLEHPNGTKTFRLQVTVN